MPRQGPHSVPRDMEPWPRVYSVLAAVSWGRGSLRGKGGPQGGVGGLG